MIYERTPEAQTHHFWVTFTNINDMLHDMKRLQDNLVRERMDNISFTKLISECKRRVVEHIVEVLGEAGVNAPKDMNLNISFDELEYRIRTLLDYIDAASYFARTTGMLTQDDIKRTLSVFYETKYSPEDAQERNFRICYPSKKQTEDEQPEDENAKICIPKEKPSQGSGILSSLDEEDKKKAFFMICRGLGQVRQY